MSLFGLESISFCGLAMSVAGNLATDPVKKKINELRGYKNHDVPRCLRDAWKLTIRDLTAKAIAEHKSKVSTATREQINSAASEITSDSACKLLFPDDLTETSRQLLGMPGHDSPEIASWWSDRLTNALVDTAAQLMPAMPPLPGPLVDTMRAGIFVPFQRYFIECAFKHDEQARAELILQQNRWFTRIQLDIKEDTGHIRTKVDEIHDAVVGHKRTRNLNNAIPSNLPSISSTFVRRETVSKEIHDALGGGGGVGAIKQAAARAHGGFGKTVAAVMYADQFKDFYTGGRFFLSMEKQDMVTALSSLAKYLGVDENAKPEAAAATVKQILEDETDKDRNPAPTLLILDNIVDAGQWSGLVATGLVPSGGCRVLITTRAEKIPQAAMVRVGKLTSEEAREIYKRFCAIADVRGGGGRSLPTDQEADAITGLVGGLAVAVAAIAARMKLRPDLTWDAYGNKLKAIPVDQLPDASQDVRDEIGLDRAALAEHRRTLHIIDGVLNDLPPAERRAIEYAAVLPEDLVPRPWLLTVLEQDFNRLGPDANGASDPLRLTATQDADDPMPPSERVLAHLDTLDLLAEHGENGKILSLHRLWRQRIHERAEAEKREIVLLRNALAECAAKRRSIVVGVDDPVKGAAIQNPLAVRDATLRWELSPLAAFAIALAKAGDLRVAIGVAWWVSSPLTFLGRFADARAVLDAMLADEARASAQLGRDELSLLWSNLALIQQAQGDLPGARANMEKAIAIQSTHFAPDHPILAGSWSNLATIQRAQGDLPGARASMEKAIAINSKHFAPDHPTLAISWSNLALIQKAQGDLPAAQGSAEKAISILSKHFAPDHPSLATVLSNLATIQQDQGDLRGARGSMEKAIAIDMKHFAPDHPTLATSWINLAMIQRAQGDLRGARGSMEKAIAILSKNVASDHPTLAISWSNLAMIQMDQGDLHGARANMEKAIAIEMKHFAPDHPNLAIRYNNLAHICIAEGKIAKAVALWRRSYPIRLKNLGPDHPYTKGDAAALRRYDPPGP